MCLRGAETLFFLNHHLEKLSCHHQPLTWYGGGGSRSGSVPSPKLALSDWDSWSRDMSSDVGDLRQLPMSSCLQSSPLKTNLLFLAKVANVSFLSPTPQKPSMHSSTSCFQTYTVHDYKTTTQTLNAALVSLHVDADLHLKNKTKNSLKLTTASSLASYFFASFLDKYRSFPSENHNFLKISTSAAAVAVTPGGQRVGLQRHFRLLTS